MTNFKVQTANEVQSSNDKIGEGRRVFDIWILTFGFDLSF